MDKALLLPKTDKEGVPYLSYSQYSTWKRNKRDYIRQYFYGEKFEGNAYTDFGSMVGEALEHDDYGKFTEEEAEFLKTVPRFDEFEREIKLQMDGFYMKGYIDTIKSDFSIIADYKTGSIEKKTAEYDSDDYHQLEIYCADILQREKVLPKTVEVYLIGRTGNAFKGEDLKLDLKYQIIKKNVTEERIKEVLAEVQAVAEEISTYYQVFLKMTGLI